MLGHRGSRVAAGPPENSLGALIGALDAGAAGVETDVRRLADDTLVLHHDATLPDGRPLVGLGAVEAREAGVLALTDLLDARCGRGRLVLEVKNGPSEPGYDAPDCVTAALLVDVLAGRGDVGDVVVSSFDWFSLEKVRRRGGPPTALLTPPGMALRAGAAWCAENGAAELHASVFQVLAEGDAGVEECRSRGVALVPWTVTAVDQALIVRALGVDGLICDDPAVVVRAFA